MEKKTITRHGLSWADRLKCAWCAISIFGAPLYADAIIEAPFWVYLLALLNMYLSAKAVNTVKWPEEKTAKSNTL